MSRYSDHKTVEHLFKAGQVWWDRSLSAGQSVFQEKNIWTLDNVLALEKHFSNNLDVGSGNFFEKLQEQLAQCTNDVKQLAAEMLWLMLLCPSSVGPAKKREAIERVWKWSGEALPANSPLLSDVSLKGVGSAGTSYNTNRWRELAYCIEVTKNALKLPDEERLAIFGDFKSLGSWLSKFPESERRQFRHMLLFLLHPDHAERIFSTGERKTIAGKFGEKSKSQVNQFSAAEIDQELLDIRRTQEAKFGTEELDFYLPPLYELWQAKPVEEPLGIADVQPPYDATQPINKIFYGPPGTGKTHTLNALKEKYVVQQASISHEQWLSEQLKPLSWFDVVFMCLYDLGRSAKVKEIENHPFFIRKAKAVDRRQHLKAQIWATLQTHTVEQSIAVKYKNRVAPLVFDKDSDSHWQLAGNWQEDCEDLIDLARQLKQGAPLKADQVHYAFVTFHQAYSYEDFVEGIRPVQDPETDQLVYRVEPGIFRQICQDAKNSPDTRFAVFIDEINRGNIAKIFGELITLIEPDKRGVYDDEGTLMGGMEVLLPYSRDPFSVPRNLDIYGTMNTADRSIALLDTALRRRFQFKELMPSVLTIKGSSGTGYIEDGEGGQINLRALLETMNQRIRFLLSRELTLGHAYLYNVQDFATLREVFLNQFIPLLQEYFYDDWHRIQLVFRDVEQDNQPVDPQIIEHSVMKTGDVLGFEHDDFEDLLDYQVATPERITPEAIRKIYEPRE